MFNTYDLFSMKGKNVLITGGRVMYGLGATMALADAGANLYLASHSVESAREFVEQLSAEKGIKVTAVPFDQGDPASIDAMFKTVIADGGHTYAVDKSGLTAWIRHAASYYGQYGVRINSLCPGGLQSYRTDEAFAKQYSKHTQLGRLANQEDVSGLILTLASDAGAYLTGLNIPVDGGYTAL